MLEEHPDPFDSYRLESDETRDVFTVLPPMNLGLGSSTGVGGGKKFVEEERETGRSGNGHERRASMDSTASPRRGEGKKPAMSVSEVLGLDQPDGGERTTTTNGTPKRTTQTATNDKEDQEDQDESGESGFLTSKPTPTESLEPATSTPITPVDSSALTTPTHDPFSEPSLTDESAPFLATRPEATRMISAKAREHGRRLSKVTEVEPVETDPMSGDWSNPVNYERSLSSGLNGRDGYESGEVRTDFLFLVSLFPPTHHSLSVSHRMNLDGEGSLCGAYECSNVAIFFVLLSNCRSCPSPCTIRNRSSCLRVVRVHPESNSACCGIDLCLLGSPAWLVCCVFESHRCSFTLSLTLNLYNGSSVSRSSWLVHTFVCLLTL